MQAAPGHAATISATGNLAQDDSVATFTFTLSAADNVTLRTFSYAGGTNGAGTAISAGGFDPTLALFDDAGNLLMSQDDATPECSGVDSDPVTSECFDVLLTTSLAAGSYLVAITQFDNHALGPTWADGFSQSGYSAAPPGSSAMWTRTPARRSGQRTSRRRRWWPPCPSRP
ncbi:MAG: DVUA0089 family protein [Gammaproteobacteria bacterium]|nr:DVUA0089 family protein [Gammaproteobacteria bacterium]